jgi:dTDP-4-amino-4,6-dideoxygalactose transaminase
MIEDKSRIWLSSPHMSGDEQKYIKEAFDENWIAPLGSNILGFEKDLEDYLRPEKETAPYNDKGVNVTVLNSGTAAIHLALILLGVGKGDEVLVQSHTHIASVNPVVYLGATPVFIDSETDTWNMCPDTLEEAIKDRLGKGKKIKAIIAVHLYGMPYKADEINAVSQKYNIPVIEDSAEALGSRYKGKMCGTLGDIGVLSFNGNKIITTSGGGAIITASQDQKDRVMYLASQAKDNVPYYQHREIGYNYKMSNIVAGIGRGQMEVLEERIVLRREVNDFYKSLFSGNTAVKVLTEPDERFYSNYWLSTLLLDPKLTKVVPSDIWKILESKNIESRPLWKPMHLQPVFDGCMYYGGNISENLFNNGLCLPSGSNLTPEQKEKIFDVLNKISF